MCTGFNWKTSVGAVLLGVAILCGGSLRPANAASDRAQKRTKKQEPPAQPPLPSGPTGPVQPIPLDSQPPVPPQVTYQDNQLTIVAPNSTLADILRAVRKQTGAEIEVPPAPERVVTHLGPGPARDVVADLLNGSRFNYVLLGSPGDNAALTRVVLVAKTGSQEVTPTPAPETSLAQQPAANNMPQQQEQMQEAEADSADDSNDDNADQSATDTEQQPAQPQDQNTVKTPQQMLQEMQQRQMQLQQQQQQPGQPPVPGPGRPPGSPPQDQ